MIWTDLTPTFEEPVSPALAQAVEELNRNYEELPPQNLEELSNLVEDLRSNPPTPTVTEQAMEMSPRPVEEPRPEATPSTSAAVVITETVAETPRMPLLLSRRATAVPAPTKSQPQPPTSAAKCPRPEFQGPVEEPRRKKKKPRSLTALQEI